MEPLRWILLLIGLVLIAGIYWLGRRQGKDDRREGLFERARRAARDDKGGDEPAADPVEPDLDIGDIDVHGFDVEGRPGEAGVTRERAAPLEPRDSDGPEPEPEEAESRVPDDRPAAPVDTAAESPLGSWSAEDRSDAGQGVGPDPEPRPAPEPDRESAPSRDPEHDPEPDAGQDSEPEPVVTRPEIHAEHPDPPEAASSGRTSSNAAPTTSSGRQREEDGARGRTADSQAEERVVVLHVVAPEGERLVGARLREALESCGMHHGAYSIFHASDSEGSIVFSAANAVEPGTFDRTTMDTLTTPGIALFMQVPGAQSAETVFDRMLSTARSVADALEANVLDERHSTLTRQTEQHLREELRLLDRRTGSLQR